MSDLSYKLSGPQQLRLTLEDCAVCLINHDDPYLSACPTKWKKSNKVNCTKDQTDPEFQELKKMALRSERKTQRLLERAEPPKADVRVEAERIYRQTAPLSNPTVSFPLAEAWVREHFEYRPNTSVARSDIYYYYIQQCDHQSFAPCNPANFGKVVKVVFPKICTRRIGVRGNSKYHYYGIGPKQGDVGPLVLVKTGKNRQCFSYEAKADSRDKQRLMKTSSYQRNLRATDEDRAELLALLEPATKSNVRLPVPLTNIMNEFLALYRSHSVEILEYILVAHFYQVREVVVEFWRRLPLQFITCSLMTYPVAMEAIVMYDQLTYQAICRILLPDPVQPTPSGLVQFIKDFVDNLDFWIAEGLNMYPKRLREQKLEACYKFQMRMRRNLQLSWTATAARFVLHNHELVNRLQVVLQSLDIGDITGRCYHDDLDEDTVRQYLGRFQQLLINNCALEEYIDWIETIIIDHLHGNEADYRTSAEDVSKQLILQWSYISGQILLQLTLVASPSLGSFHLLEVLFKDYAAYYIHDVLRL
ncbi:transcription factor RFX4-like [Argopecten irradians]|uniref:transcription factor RFX4-like n=1 Tax=Argopecten irradians TaxID=31199 RepID=UPI00371DB9FE